MRIHKIKWYFLLAPLFFTLTTSCFASRFNDVEDIDNIHNITQDDTGFIWLSSQQGLIRFDGQNFINFSSANRRWPLPFKWLHEVTVIDTDTLLLSTECCGAWLFNTTSGQYQQIAFNHNKRSLDSTLTLFHQGIYYSYSTNINTLLSLDTASNKTRVITEKVKAKQLVSTSGQAYLINSEGLFKISQNSVSLYKKAAIKEAITVADNLILLTDKGLTLIRPDGTEFNKPLNVKLVTATAHQSENTFYAINEYDQLYQFDIIQFNEIKHSFPSTDQYKVNKLFHDKSNVLWLSTNMGLKRFVERKTRNYHENLKQVFQTVEQINDELVLTSYGNGISSFNTGRPLVKNHHLLPRRVKTIYDSEAVDNKLYLNTFDGLWQYDSTTKQMSKIDIVEKNQVLLGMSYSNGKLYIALDGDGFLIYDLTTEKIIDKADKTSNFSSPEVIDVIPVNNKVWLATAKGIDVYNPYSKQITTIFDSPNHKILALLQKGNKVFAASMGQGIYAFDNSGTLLSKIGDGITFTGLTDINGELWASAKPGLYRLDADNYNLKLIAGTEPYTLSNRVKEYKNQVYIAHESGVLQIPLDNQQDFHPKVLISQTTVSGKSYLLNTSIELDTPNDVVTLDLASLDYRPGPPKHYEYKINNGIWHQVSGNQITLTGLSPGDYYLEIRGTNSLEQWSKYHAYTNISVAFPWYWTLQMRIIYLVIAIGIVSLCSWLFYLRSKSINHIYQALRNDSKSKGRAALNVTRNLKQVLESINSESTPDFDVKKVLEQSIEELTNATKAEEPDALYGKTLEVALPYFVQYMHRKHHINIKLSTELDSSKLSYELQADIYKIIYEAISSNMLNHSSRNFSISMQDFKGKVWLTIQDDNEGFTNYQSRISFDMAMYYIRQIASKYKASVNTFNNSHEGQGSQLVISIPLMKLD